MRRKKKSGLNKTVDLALGGALALQGVEVMRDVRTGGDLTANVPAFVGIGIAGVTSKMVLDLIESAYPSNKKRVKKKKGGQTN